ncbi:MAG: methyltransferase regulatory domain-containing protein [Burkholderiaceae bacterium]|nr:methyltransferase regulatory domain-containing protein [Burkholderiaceae bacterium]
MASWQDGYITDIPYTAGFYRELAPSYLHLLCVLMGVRPPQLVDREYGYCELACGQGLGTLLLAAGNPRGRFVGVDFNPAQIAKAQDLAERAGLSNVQFREESFAAMAERSGVDQTKFDVIVLHGIYSWVSQENRGHIVNIIRDRLKPGGVVYVSYNCMPGWAPFVPVQRMMREYVKAHPGRSDQNVMAAIDFVNQLAGKGARYFKANESVTRNLGRLQNKERTYLAHEYLNEHWEALYHIDVAREMQEARLEYVGSATVSDNVLALNVPKDISEMLGSAGGSSMVETIKDFTVNRQFRRDLYVRGPVQLSNAQFVHEMNKIMFVLTLPPDKITLKLSTAAGELDANEPVVRPILDKLRQGPAVFKEIAEMPALAGVAAWQVAQALSLLVESGQTHPMLGDGSGNVDASRSLNQVLVEAALLDDSMQFLSAPAIGSGSFVANPEQLIILALRSIKKPDARAVTEFVWKRFKEQNKRLIKDGKRIEDDAENVAELETRVRDFMDVRMPLLKQLGVIH